ncbi:MAG: acyltransferase family protein [Janthinobacterium lividum]
MPIEAGLTQAELVPTVPGRRTSRLPGLDLLRALAICWVMLYHASQFGFISGDHWLVAFGWMGVDLFFVLSGFLIAGQLLAPRLRGIEPDYRRFLVRRLLRTLPAYLAVVALYFLLPGAREYDAIQPLWQFLSFSENLFIRVPPPKAFSHVWSLCVEEQFYLLFPVMVTLLSIKSSARKTVSAILAVLLAGIALRGMIWLHDLSPPGIGGDGFGPAYLERIYYPTWTRLDGLLAGIAAATFKTFRPGLWHRLTARPDLLLGAGVAGVGMSMLFFADRFTSLPLALFGFPLLSSSMALMVMAGSTRRSIIGRRSIPGAGAIASIAYSLYLSHKIVFHTVADGAIPTLGHAPGIALATALACALLAGCALYLLVERPFLKLRDRVGRGVRYTIPMPIPERS